MRNMSYTETNFHTIVFVPHKNWTTGAFASIPGDEIPNATISCNYDYKKVDCNFQIYFDIGIQLDSVATALFRTSFEITGINLTWDKLFIPSIIKDMIDTSLKNSILNFQILTSRNNLKTTGNINISDKIKETLAIDSISQYFEYRKPDDEQNAFLINTIGLECTSSSDCMIPLICTFIIMDEILYNNPHFDTQTNRETFGNIVPLPKYNTLKYYCQEIEVRDIDLTFYELIMFSHCIDCAMQILLGDKADYLLPSIEPKGLTKSIRDDYFKLGTEYFNQLNQMLTNTNAHLADLDQKHDWINLIK